METRPADAPVGGEIDAWCTKCRLDLNHKVIAKLDGKIKRVQCLTCEGQHAFKAAAATGAGGAKKGAKATPAERPAARRAPKRPKVVDDNRPARPYATDARFVSSDVLLHPQYGRGVVAVVRGDKIDVEFETGAKTLIHRRGA